MFVGTLHSSTIWAYLLAICSSFYTSVSPPLSYDFGSFQFRPEFTSRLKKLIAATVVARFPKLPCYGHISAISLISRLQSSRLNKSAHKVSRFMKIKFSVSISQNRKLRLISILISDVKYWAWVAEESTNSGPISVGREYNS